MTNLPKLKIKIPFNNTEDEIMDGCLVTHQGAIRHEKLKALAEEKGETR